MVKRKANNTNLYNVLYWVIPFSSCTHFSVDFGFKRELVFGLNIIFIFPDRFFWRFRYHGYLPHYDESRFILFSSWADFKCVVSGLIWIFVTTYVISLVRHLKRLSLFDLLTRRFFKLTITFMPQPLSACGAHASHITASSKCYFTILG